MMERMVDKGRVESLERTAMAQVCGVSGRAWVNGDRDTEEGGREETRNKRDWREVRAGAQLANPNASVAAAAARDGGRCEHGEDCEPGGGRWRCRRRGRIGSSSSVDRRLRRR